MDFVENQFTTTVDPSSPSSEQQQQQQQHIKRPMNPFMVWSRLERRRLQSLHPRMHNSEISKLLGSQWQAMSRDDKQEFVLESERLRKMHRKLYPNYRYRPQKKEKPNAISLHPHHPMTVSSESGSAKINWFVTPNPTLSKYCYAQNNETVLPTVATSSSSAADSPMTSLPSHLWNRPFHYRQELASAIRFVCAPPPGSNSMQLFPCPPTSSLMAACLSSSSTDKCSISRNSNSFNVEDLL